VQGSIYLAPGADVNLEGKDDDSAVIRWTGSSYSIEMGFDTTGEHFAITATTDEVSTFLIGGDWNGSTDKKFAAIDMECGTQTIIGVAAGSEDYIGYYFNTGSFRSDKDNVADCGSDTYPWANVYSYDYPAVADFYCLDDKNDLDLINSIKGSGEIDPETDLELIDDDTIPEILLKLNRKTGTIARTESGKPFISGKVLFSLILGAIRELDKKKKDK
jgi:hypothetical protein